MLESALNAIRARIQDKDLLATEEATKNALVMPFIHALGYNPFDPYEVIPEFVADVGVKKGEKVDYCIKKDGQAILLIECKKCDDRITGFSSQLYRYFSVTKARFAVYTNGILYKFFSDLDKPNVMDQTPFLEVNLEELEPGDIEELKKFHKANFDIESILGDATELKYLRRLTLLLDPS